MVFCCWNSLNQDLFANLNVVKINRIWPRRLIVKSEFGYRTVISFDFLKDQHGTVFIWAGWKLLWTSHFFNQMLSLDLLSALSRIPIVLTRNLWSESSHHSIAIRFPIWNIFVIKVFLGRETIYHFFPTEKLRFLSCEVLANFRFLRNLSAGFSRADPWHLLRNVSIMIYLLGALLIGEVNADLFVCLFITFITVTHIMRYLCCQCLRLFL
jgi:hypothetical protein